MGFSPSTTVMTGTVDVGGLPEHQVSAVRCREVVRRSVVAGEMSVCEGCRGAVEAMRSMVERCVGSFSSSSILVSLNSKFAYRLASYHCLACTTSNVFRNA